MTKKELRKIFLEKRKSLTENECAALNLNIYSRFFAGVDLSFVNTLHTYLPIAGNKEPDTWMIIDRLRREHSHARISVPRVTENGQLEHFYFEGAHQLTSSSWGIPEPKQGVPTPVEKIDLVIVPLIVADKQGHRVGYGKGFYDKFLSSVKSGCMKVGLSFFEPVERIADVAPYDIPLNACITPEKVISFRQPG